MSFFSLKRKMLHTFIVTMSNNISIMIILFIFLDWSQTFCPTWKRSKRANRSICSLTTASIATLHVVFWDMSITVTGKSIITPLLLLSTYTDSILPSAECITPLLWELLKGPLEGKIHRTLPTDNRKNTKLTGIFSFKDNLNIPSYCSCTRDTENIFFLLSFPHIRASGSVSWSSSVSCLMVPSIASVL